MYLREHIPRISTMRRENTVVKLFFIYYKCNVGGSMILETK